MSRSPFPALRVAGGLLPADLFGRVLEGKDLPGYSSAEYGLAPHESVRQAATRAFDYLGGAWQAFTRERDKAHAEGRPLTGLTRERWLLTVFRALDYGIVPTTPTGGLVADDKAFGVSHLWEHVPIHLLGWGVDLDRRTKGMIGAAEAAPQSMVQELLNRTDAHLWAILSNGQKLRLLRDSRSLAGSAYVEFDLELIFDEQLFPDWVLLFRLVHASRLVAASGEPAASCWLEQWRSNAVKQGERALERLRGGVEQAITTLGTGFLRANPALRDRLAAGTLSRDDYKRAVLRLVYRLLFWFVAEDRDVLLDPDAPSAARARYLRFFSAQRLRDRARRGGLDHHEDLWEAVRLVFVSLGTEQGRPELAVPGIGGLFERITRDRDDKPIEPTLPDALDEPLDGLLLTNEALITAVRHLAIVESDGQRRPVDFRNLDSEELGSVYESLLELHPVYDPLEQTFTLVGAAGNERKETGSYYTPTSLTEALLDSALDPVLNEAAAVPGDAEAKVASLLGVTVCDPACGSGHFLVAAARRIARRVAQLRSGENEPSPDLVRSAMREVVSRCIHGVDINEMAAELAKVSLWLESVEPGKPLAFLDANIRVGNSLLGTTPALIEAGIPDEAFTPIEGDDKAAAKTIRERSARESAGQVDDLFSSGGLELTNASLAIQTREVVHSLPTRLGDVIVARRRLHGIDAARSGLRRVADAWCAAFVQEKTPDTVLCAITKGVLEWIGAGPSTLPEQQVTERVERLARDYRFFHWHAEFPHIFAVPDGGGDVDTATGWRGGFHCVLGNPPWERVKLQEQEFFATRRPDIAGARKAATRKKMIAALATSEEPVDRSLHDDYRANLRRAEGWSHLLRTSGRYPLTGRGDINTYSVFAEVGRTVLNLHGRVGMVLPTGIATDATTQYFFKNLVSTQTLASLYDFENEEKLFPHIDHRVRFCLWTAAGRAAQQDRIDLAFRLRQAPQILERRFTLTPEEIALLNPNTGTCPVFDYRRNAEITLAIYRRVPVLWREEPESNPWELSFQAMLHMANDSGLFHDQETLEADAWTLRGNIFVRGDKRMLPLIEAKMVYHFDHRLGTYEGQTQAQANVGAVPRINSAQKNDPSFAVLPRYWVPEREVDNRLARKHWDRGWLLGWRNITNTGNERTMMNSAMPRVASGNSLLLMLPGVEGSANLYANLSSFILDYVGRQKMAGTNYTFNYVKQLAVLPPERYDENCLWDSGQRLTDWITSRVLELSYTAYDMAAFAEDHGDQGTPFRWDEERRFWLRVELDAAYFHLYGVPRDDVDYVMDTFRAFRNNDQDRFTRTKKAILEIYDAMADSIRTSQPYRTVLDPPPGHGPRHPACPTE